MIRRLVWRRKVPYFFVFYDKHHYFLFDFCKITLRKQLRAKNCSVYKYADVLDASWTEILPKSKWCRGLNDKIEQSLWKQTTSLHHRTRLIRDLWCFLGSRKKFNSVIKVSFCNFNCQKSQKLIVSSLVKFVIQYISKLDVFWIIIEPY